MSMLLEIGRRARAASQWLAQAGTAEKNAALFAMARRLLQSADEILVANATDLATARELKPSLVDRLTLTPARIEAMATGIEEIAALTDPVGRVLAEWTRPNGLRFSRVSVPLGVIGIIYESRPNVTADAGALCVKSGNAAVLRGGSDSFESSSAIVAALRKGLHDAKLPMDVIQTVGTRDRAAVGELLSGLAGTIDLIVPRGGKSLVARVQSDARVPVFSHLEGICHVYVDKAADLDMAESILINAKMRRTGICGAAETLLVDQAIVATAMPRLVRALMNAGCEVRGDLEAQRVDAGVLPATAEDWQTEYLAAVISVCAVDGVEGAINHICKYGSQHTDSIITDDSVTAETFMNEVDSAIVLHNASTQFADGGEFGFGAEIGIATGKLHARGPVGVEQLTTFKYKVRGEGQVRAI